MNTALSLPPTSCALVIHEDGKMELSFPTRPDEAEVPPRELFIAAIAMLLEREDEFMGEIVSRGFTKPPVN